MSANKQIGQDGEQLAATWLVQNGYVIDHVNWRYKHWEVDIIAHQADTLFFIEVKTRTNTKFGHPEESITKDKMKFLKQAADQYLFLNKGWKWVEFCVLAINMANGKATYWFNKDVYF